MPSFSKAQESSVEERLFDGVVEELRRNPSVLFEQYKLCVEMADRVSARRQSANAFYLSISSLLLGSLAYFGGSSLGVFDTSIVALSGVSFCFLWLRNIRSYSNLNSGKFAVIIEIEKKLACRPFEAEWEALGRGKKSWRYRPFKEVEVLVPVLFIALYIGLILREILLLPAAA